MSRYPTNPTPDLFSDEEWVVRCEVAALYRLLAQYRWTDLNNTHISGHIPGRQGEFLINDFTKLFHEIRASDLVRVAADGTITDARGKDTPPINPAAFTIHSAVQMARPDLPYVIHTHSGPGIAVSAQKDGLLPISQHALKFHGALSYHDYEGVAEDLAMRAKLAEDLGPTNRAMILRNHGLLAGGRTAAESWDYIYYLERSCHAQIMAQSGGAELIYPSEEVCRYTASQFLNPDGSPLESVDWVWDACLREIDAAHSGVWS